jgi:FKBP-type peptidyl-prolyl cis-trans isomerase
MKVLFFLFTASILFFLGCLDEPVDQAVVDRNIITDYITANNLNAIEDDSGMFYVIDAPGGEEKPGLTDSVIIDYKGYLTNGNVFDQTPAGTLSRFKLNELIAGWQIGIPKFGRGGNGVLLIPSALGYGNRSFPGLPANSVLVFDIELDDFN